MDRSAYGGYGAVARDFNSDSDYHSPWVWQWLQESLALPADTARILDIGCGTGYSTRQMKKHGFQRVLGVDPDERMLAIAREYHDIEYHLALTSALPFASAAFEAATAHWSFNYFCDDERAVGELKRVLKSGGIFMTVTWPLSRLAEKRGALLRQIIGQGEPETLPGYQRADRSYAPLLRSYGFRHVQTRTGSVVVTYTVEEAYRYMRRSGYLSRVPQEKLEEAYNALRELCEREQDENAKLYREINVVADIGWIP